MIDKQKERKGSTSNMRQQVLNIDRQTPSKRMRTDSNSESNFVDVFSKNRSSYAQIVKKKRQPTVIVKVKTDNQEHHVTHKDIKESVGDPIEAKVKNLKNISNGGMVISCDTNEAAENLKKSIESSHCDKYEVSVQQPMYPRVKIIGFSDDYDDDNFISTVKKQNSFLTNKNIRVIKKYADEYKTYHKYVAILEVDSETFRILMDQKRIFIGWDSCRVVQHFGIMRCFRCCAFGHRMKDCKEQIFTCGRCASSHHHRDCKSDVLKCTNCIKINSERNLNINVDHSALSNECNVYQRLVTRKMNIIDYED